jgi:hypothetical protein
MTTFPNSPRLIKGAIVGIDIFTPIPNVILFQYNPDSLTRRLQSQMAGEGGAGSESLRLKGAPEETISLDIEIDATDQLEKAESTALSMGISPHIWGPSRVLPVTLTEFSITEEAYDVNLNPIRAKVSLGLRVLNYNDLPLSHPGYSIFLVHQTVKETMAAMGSISSLAAVGGVSIEL